MEFPGSLNRWQVAYNHPIFYIVSGGLYATYHPLWEPETTVDLCRFIPITHIKGAFVVGQGAHNFSPSSNQLCSNNAFGSLRTS